MPKIKFTKMNGLGNDFVILDYSEFQKTKLSPDKLAQKLCNRNFSIGADGLIIVNPDTDKADISWIFYNSDGSVAQMCGNGMRCFSRYVYDNKIIDKKEFSVETKAGIIVPKIISENEVCVNMGIPILEPNKIPCKTKTNLNIPYTLNNKDFLLNTVSMGNPHCVIFVEKDSKELAYKYGSIIENDKLFPEKTNVEFVEILSKDEVAINVWERGCGITSACGTGACATAVAGILNGYLNNCVKANLPGGELKIEWKGGSDDIKHSVFMTGRADYSFFGEVII
ncbi:MAG: diaminopimelate epimerase [Candidatus Gastranaerophilales bacterium]|nr:diaminopimelate epimerase [Candidatus Gastranaerophilales bacterium]